MSHRRRSPLFPWVGVLIGVLNYAASRGLLEVSDPLAGIPVRYNIAPTQEVVAVLAEDGGRKLEIGGGA